MREALYPKERYPQGHPDLATSLNNMGLLLQKQGNYGEARGYLQRALEMVQALYPKERYPQGHPDLAPSLNNLGGVLQAQGNYGGGAGVPPAGAGDDPGALSQGAVSPGPSRPGHQPEQPGRPALGPGQLRGGAGYHQRALEMDQALYPRERYPQGHPDLARSLNNLGYLL